MSSSKNAASYLLIMPTANDAPLFSVPERASAAIKILRELREGGRIRLYAYAVLPDHIRVLLEPKEGQSLREILRLLRGGIARSLNSLGSRGQIWMPKSEIRKLWSRDLVRTVSREVEQAPVLAGITPNAESFLFCSAHADAELDSPESPEVSPVAHAAAAA